MNIDELKREHEFLKKDVEALFCRFEDRTGVDVKDVKISRETGFVDKSNINKEGRIKTGYRFLVAVDLAL